MVSPTTLSLSDMDIIAATRVWLEKAVIGLNLCPFAKAVHVKHQIRYVVSRARTVEELRTVLVEELRLLESSPANEIDTTLLIHPFVLQDFFDFNDFLAIADVTLQELGLEGELQLASFHPHYQFADAGPRDIENYTNRAPFPTLHLLREASIDRAVEAFPDAATIFEANKKTLRELGFAGWEALEIPHSKPHME